MSEDKVKSLLGGVEGWKLASARKFLYSSAILFFSIAVVWLLKPEFAASFEKLNSKSAAAAGGLLLLLAFPVGYTINALSYFSLGLVISWIERVLYRFAGLGFSWASISFEARESFQLFQLDSWTRLQRAIRIIVAFRQVPALAQVNWQQRSALGSFVRNLALLSLLTSAYASLSLQEAALVFPLLTVFFAALLLSACIEMYVKLELLKAVRDLDDVLFFDSPITLAEGYDGLDLLRAKLYRLDKLSRARL